MMFIISIYTGRMYSILDYFDQLKIEISSPEKGWSILNQLPEGLKPKTAVFERGHRRFIVDDDLPPNELIIKYIKMIASE